MPTDIKTTNVTGRRTLQFNSLDDILNDLDLLAAAKEVRSLGNWSPGQNFAHLAKTINSSIHGFPYEFPAPIRFTLRLVLKRRILTKPMTPGFKLPQKARPGIIPDSTSFHDGLAALRAAIAQLQSESKRVRSPFLGPLTNAEWNALHCRHAELHLSFLIPS